MGTLVSSTNKTDCHDIAEILLKVALNAITLTPHVVVTLFYSGLCTRFMRWYIQNRTLSNSNLKITYILMYFWYRFVSVFFIRVATSQTRLFVWWRIFHVNNWFPDNNLSSLHPMPTKLYVIPLWECNIPIDLGSTGQWSVRSSWHRCQQLCFSELTPLISYF